MPALVLKTRLPLAEERWLLCPLCFRNLKMAAVLFWLNRNERKKNPKNTKKTNLAKFHNHVTVVVVSCN